MLARAFDSVETGYRRAEIGMTPLIDMIFILLIFFVVATTFTRETGIDVEKARASTAQLVQKNLVLVSVARDGTYWHEDRARSLEEVVEMVLTRVNQFPDSRVVVIPDKDGRVEPLVTLMDHLRARDVTRFSLGTVRATEKP